MVKNMEQKMKTEQIRESETALRTDFRDTFKIDGVTYKGNRHWEENVKYRYIENFWLQKLAEQREDYKKTLNSGRKMYQQGREDMKKEIIDWCKKRCQDNIRINGTDKWNGDMEELIEVLKKCQL